MTQQDMYNNLRKWQLARLRNLAREGAERTANTPAGLIASDKEAIRQMIKAGAGQSVPKSFKRFRLDYLLWFWLSTQLFALIFQMNGARNTAQAISNYFQITLGSLLPFQASANAVDLSTSSSSFSFLSFFYLPVLLLTIAPGYSFKSVLLAMNRSSSLQDSLLAKIRKPAIAFSISAILVVLPAAFLFNSGINQSAFNSNLKADADALTRFSLVCASLLSFLLVFFAKLQSCQDELALALLSKIEKDIYSGDFQNQDGKSQDKNNLLARIEMLELSLQELLQRERAIADFSKNVIMSFDRKLVIDAISPSVLMQWGYHQYELLNRSFKNIIFGEDISLVEEKLKTHKDSGPFEILARIRKKDNSIADYAWYLDWSQSLERYFVSFEDVSDRMNLERARDDFIAQLTHDMRSPLAAVVMTLALFSEKVFGELPEKVYTAIFRAQDGLSRVLTLINTILETEKLQHNKQSIEFLHFKLAELCKKIIGELEAPAHERKVRLELIGGEIEVEADYNLLSRVISNLVSNALSFSPENSSLKIELVKSGENALVRITDNGPGIHQDYHRLIFERYRTPKQLESKRVSTGLGLWICREIVTAHGGVIGVDSEPGKGSTFWFTLPLKRKTGA